MCVLAHAEGGFAIQGRKMPPFARQFSFLGHIIDSEGVRMDPGKISAINEYPAPWNVKEPRIFLGMA